MNMARLSPRWLLAAAVLAACLLELAAGGTVLLKTRTRGKSRQTRGIIKRLLCKRFGNCNSGYGGFGGYPGGGYQGGYQGYPGAFQGHNQIPAINIGISQSQSSSSGSTGGYSSSAFPNNYQYNVGHAGAGGYSPGPYSQGPYPAHSTPYSPNNLGGYGGYNQQGYAGYNHGGFTGYGGPYNNGNYGFQHPHSYGDEVTEDGGPIHQNIHESEGSNNHPGGTQYGAEAYTPSGSFAYARSADRDKAPAPK